MAEGNHVLRVVVDPEDKFADRKRENNAAQLSFKVRSPGGTLRVHVQDYNVPHPPLANAVVVLGDLWAGHTNTQGVMEIPDVPRGAYPANTLYADRDMPVPRYFTAYAPAFTVADNQTQDLTLQCQRAMNIVGDVRVAGTGQLIDDEYLEAFVLDPNDALFVQGGSTGHRYRIEDVPPGQHRLICGAYGFQTKETTTQIRRASPTTDDVSVDVELVDGPRATITGKVVDLTTNRPLEATVWLQGAPRAATTAADGTFTLTRVAAGKDYKLWANAESHSTESVDTPVLAGGQTADVGIIKLGAITPKFTSIDFDATTWAICEESPDTGGISAFKVNTKFGAFTGALGLTYHSTAGQNTMTADNLIIWVQGGDFIQGGVSTEIGLESFTGVDIDTLSVGIMADVLGGVGKGFKVLEGVNKLAAWLQGPVDPQMLHRNDRVVANYTSHTGSEYKEDPLIDIPMSTDIPIAVSFRGVGETIVRVDEIEVKDSSGQTKTIRAEWYSPGFSVFRVNQAFDGNTLEVKLKVAVLNERLQSGVLGTASRNLIHWKPLQTRWLRISGFQYD